MSVSPDAKPKLPRGVRLTHNEAQGGWVLLAPERVFKADAIAHEIIKRCTGEATMTDHDDLPAQVIGRSGTNELGATGQGGEPLDAGGSPHEGG